MNGPSTSVSHLLVADDVLRPGRCGSSRVTVCGEQVRASNATVANQTVDDVMYCPECVCAAVDWSIRSAAR